MTEHDRIRMERALNCDCSDIEQLEEAIRGLQSTDDPSLNDLHDKLMNDYLKLKNSVVENK